MRSIFRCFFAVGAFFALSQTAQATVHIHVDISSQRMHVTSDSGQSYNWAISSARSGFHTPRGSYRPTSLQAMHRSRKYHNSPMPHSIFFAGGYAIHGTYATGSLGRPASHGCIRLSPGAAAKLFQMVKAEGASITITGSSGGAHYARAHHRAASRYAMTHHRHPASALAYGPERRSSSSVRHWQKNPGQINPAEY
jgi:hypothetical protein